MKKIAENKIRDANRKHQLSRRHNINLEVSLDNLSQHSEAKSRESSPEEELLFKELIEERLVVLLNQLPHGLREMVELVIQGYNSTEIAYILKVEPKRVYRAISWLKRKVRE